MTSDTKRQPFHASCVVIGERGVLIRGVSGSGKSTLARLLVARATQNGMFARLIGDDRVYVTESHGRLIARGHPAIAGRMEVRGVGIVETEFEQACIIRLVVDCSKQVRLRSPEDEDRVVRIHDVCVPRIETMAMDADLVLSLLVRVDGRCRETDAA